ncbi:MAG: hypothetical protein WCE79_06120 [Xanthobacteraceae bacterium]
MRIAARRATSRILRWFRKQAPRKERNLVPPPKTDCVFKKSEKYGHCKTKPSQLIASKRAQA